MTPKGRSPGLPDRVRASPLRVMRGITGIASIWAVAWGGIGVGFSVAVAALTPAPLTALLPSVVSWVVSGFLSGAGFATLLGTLERRRLLEELTLSRVAAWGALGGFGVAMLVMLIVGILPLIGLGWAALEGAKAGLLGALSAMATTAIAKAGGGEEGGRDGGQEAL